MADADTWNQNQSDAIDAEAVERMESEGGAAATVDVVGFGVEATDGEIGKVDSASYAADDGWIVVDTGPWIFGKKVMLPAGVLDEIDYESRTIRVRRSKEEIKGAPEYGGAQAADRGYRDALDGYYSSPIDRQPR